MEVIGKIKVIEQTKEVGSSGFRKRDVVVTTDEQYPQHISIQFVQDKCDILDGYKVGEDVKIGINLRGREWTNPEGSVVYFNTIQGWNINRLNSAPQHTPQEAYKEPKPTFNEEDHDDLPF